tara:strand:- start:571 stop:921 length:351 start_codon:yes stop_codon:yes gene_type:complete
MNWFQTKTTQLIALVSIVGTLAGFGYTGATYINRLENLEAKIGKLGATQQAQQAIEERFAGIEASVDYINKSLEDKDTTKDIVELKTSMATMQTEVKSLEGKVQELVNSSKNPLAQ